MLIKVFVTAALVLGVMFVVKDHAFLRSTGLLSYCEPYSNAGGGANWELCKRGTLDGSPNLTGKGCTREWARGAFTNWYCPPATPAGPEGF